MGNNGDGEAERGGGDSGLADVDVELYRKVASKLGRATIWFDNTRVERDGTVHVANDFVLRQIKRLWKTKFIPNIGRIFNDTLFLQHQNFIIII